MRPRFHAGDFAPDAAAASGTEDFIATLAPGRSKGPGALSDLHAAQQAMVMRSRISRFPAPSSRLDGSHLTDRTRVIHETVKMKGRKSFAQLHVGFVNVNADLLPNARRWLRQRDLIQIQPARTPLVHKEARSRIEPNGRGRNQLHDPKFVRVIRIGADGADPRNARGAYIFCLSVQRCSRASMLSARSCRRRPLGRQPMPPPICRPYGFTAIANGQSASVFDTKQAPTCSRADTDRQPCALLWPPAQTADTLSSR